MYTDVVAPLRCSSEKRINSGLSSCKQGNKQIDVFLGAVRPKQLESGNLCQPNKFRFQCSVEMRYRLHDHTTAFRSTLNSLHRIVQWN